MAPTSDQSTRTTKGAEGCFIAAPWGEDGMSNWTACAVVVAVCALYLALTSPRCVVPFSPGVLAGFLVGLGQNRVGVRRVDMEAYRQVEAEGRFGYSMSRYSEMAAVG